MKIDFHTHTDRFSLCSEMDVDNLLDAEKRAGMDGVVLTDHNQFWPDESINELRKKHGALSVFNGAEIGVGSLHHVITLLPEPDDGIADIDDPDVFVREVHDRGGFLIAAHPYRFFGDYAERNRKHSLDGVEIASRGMHREKKEKKARALAERWEARCFASSDAHSVDSIGAFYTEVDGQVSTEADLIECLYNHPTTPVIDRSLYSRASQLE